MYCTDSRPTKDELKRRRFECEACGDRFTTYEITSTELNALREKAGAVDDLRRLLGVS